MATILLISSDRRVCDALRGALAAHGHLVTEAASRDAGLLETVPRVGYRLAARESS